MTRIESEPDTIRSMDHPQRQTAARRSRRQLRAVLALTSGVFVLEVAGAVWTGSLALAADAAHLLTDVGGLALALFAIWISARPPTPAKTFGYYRVEILAALVNALVLLVVAVGLLVEAYHRVLAPREVLGGPMVVIAALALGAHMVGAWLLHRAAASSLNVRAVYLEVLSDALTSVGVLLAAGAIALTGWNVLDPLASGAITIFIVPRTWRLLTQAVNILLEGTPAHLELKEIEAAITGVPGVRGVHDLHVWTLTSGREAMSAHVIVEDLRESERLLEELHALLHARFGIDHTTIQLDRETRVVLRIKGRGEPDAV
jgi:cobalt-zinc-cadmium efflux system protein